MKRKILTTIMCVAMVMSSLAGCGKQDPKVELSKVMEQASKVTDIDMTSSMRISMEAQGEKLDMPMEMDIKTKNSKSDDISMEMGINMEVNGQEVEMETYYANGYYYMDASGTKIKYAMDVAEIKKQLESSMNYQELTSDMFQEVSLEEKGDSRVFAFKGNLDKMSEYLEKSLASLENAMAQELEYKFSDVEGIIKVDEDDVMKEMALNFGMNLTVQGQEVSATVESTNKINATGSDVELDMPDFEEYQEIEAPEQ